MFDTLTLDHFLDPAVRDRLADELRSAEGVAAGVYGGQASVDERVRKAQRVAVTAEQRNHVVRLLEGAKDAIGRRFDVILTTCEEPQFLRYGVGDFFVAHQDGNTPLLRDDSSDRRVSIVIALNSSSTEPREGTYGGGALVLHGRYPDFQSRHLVQMNAGALVAFRSETTHEVTPVTHGQRYAIVSWYRV